MKKQVAKVMHERKMIRSLSEARRLIFMKVIEANGKVVESIDEEVEEDAEIKVVKKK